MDTSSECPICFTEFTHPKKLPCLHSFCFKCLMKHCDENTEGDVVPCPLCRREFRIPVGGVENLQDDVDMPQFSQNREAMKLYLGDNEHITMDSRADNCVKGITVVDDKIHVIRFWKEDHHQFHQQLVYVYNMKNLKSPSNYIPLNEAQTAVQSIAGCVDRNCLYVVEGSRAYIHRVDLNDYFTVSVIKLQEFQGRYEICSVSVTSPEHNILLVLKKVTESDSDSILAECGSSGEILHKIVFDNNPTICYIRYALKIEDKIFVCHGDHSCQKREAGKCKQNICQHRIVRLNLKGDMEVLYGGHSGNGEDQLRWPRQFTVDHSFKLIFLGDNHNNRILLLNFNLKCLGQVKVPADFKEPTRVCFDSSTKRLFVGEYCGNGIKNGRLSVINFGSKI